MTDRPYGQFEAGVTGQPWTQAEVDLTVGAYFDMLAKQVAGQTVRKADVVRELQLAMPARNSRSIEAKFQNVSAVLEEVGVEWIEGYKPLEHYQRALKVSVLHALGGPRTIRDGLAAYESSTLVAPSPRKLATEDVMVPVPGSKPLAGRRRTSVSITGGNASALRDFRMHQLGSAGERWVVDLERESLRRAGRDDLSSSVRWTAHDDGDGFGYDIHSYRPDGEERLIEVKTTNWGPRTPFYITRWEIDVSKDRADHYSLYRVHGFARDPRIYVLDGNIEERARLDPKVFLGVPLV